jgi:hypothetical protein
MRKHSLIAMGLASWCACNAGQGNGELTGSIDGVSFPIVDVISATENANGASAGIIAMSTKPDLCTRIASETLDKNENILLIEVADVDATTQAPTAPTSPGLYPVAAGSASGPASVVRALFVGSDCTTDNEEDSTGGTITLTFASDGVYNGSFDVVMSEAVLPSTQDQVTGSFAPAYCAELPLLVTGGGGGGSGTCQ